MPHIGFIIFRRLRPFCPEGAGVGASTDRVLMAFCLLVYMLLLLLVSGALERNNKHGVPRCWLLLPPPSPRTCCWLPLGGNCISPLLMCLLGFSCQARIGGAQHLDPRPPSRARVLHGAKWRSEVPDAWRPFCCVYVDLMSLK